MLNNTMVSSEGLPVVLFGYESSTFTAKVRLALKLKQIPYYFVEVPSMMPRPLLVKLFNLTYRKIPVLAIGTDVYCDSSIILEALEHQFPASNGYQSLYPRDATGRTNQALIRGFASYWTDRPLFRVTTGLIPGSVWRTSFGEDRAKLIGHKLDPDKLEKKLPENLSKLDLQLSLLEDLFREADDEWVFWTPEPSAADIAIWYQLNWGMDIAAGKGIYNLTGGRTEDTKDKLGATSVFNKERYPATWLWFERFKIHMDRLPDVETKIGEVEVEKLLTSVRDQGPKLLPTPAAPHFELDKQNGLVQGTIVSVVPDDTGRDDPSFGELVAITPEEVVIRPLSKNVRPLVDARIHFPRLGFVIRVAKDKKL
ncbi:uncharacterized protein PV09_05113 [Verruconis gallopava]|uniref:GST N-terminal domain-containing protein n=1 Tax=Verruconis gallopava TaxID=253628 RepID=A0A0D2AAK9_9PEZI|nr:uncharacterized protein PV09_05113 [Verruconis gallopava]KIW03813.1 hypothetical protein PV09_05113 [Verruconis gallopava]